MNTRNASPAALERQHLKNQERPNYEMSGLLLGD